MASPNGFCASPRKRTCGGSAATTDDVEKQLDAMSRALTSIGNTVMEMDKKIDMNSSVTSTLKDTMQQVQQQQTLAAMESGSLLEFDKLLKKNIDQVIMPKIDSSMDRISKAGASAVVPSKAVDSNPQLQVMEEKARPNSAYQAQLALLEDLVRELKTQQAGILQEIIVKTSQMQETMVIMSARKERDDNYEDQQGTFTPALSPLGGDSNAPIPAQGGVGQEIVEDLKEEDVKVECVDGPPAEKWYDDECGHCGAGPAKKKTDIMEHHEEHVVTKHVDNMNYQEEQNLGSVFFFDNHVDKPPYRVEDYYKQSGCAVEIAKSNWFGHLTAFIVAMNAVYIGVDADNNNAVNIYDADWGFIFFTQFFCFFFTFELIVRFLSFKNKCDCWKDGWFRFDFFLCATMILDSWVLTVALYFAESGGDSAGRNSSFKFTQALRVLRLLKLTRMARLMRAFPELVTMVKGLVRSLRAIMSTLILIGLMCYLWAIIIHMLISEEVELNKHLFDTLDGLSFHRIGDCMWALIVDGTLMMDSPIIMTVMLYSNHFNVILAGMCFTLYTLLSALLILQMLIGVLCDVVARIGKEQSDAQAVGLVKQELLSDLVYYAGDDGKISKEELRKVMNNPKSRALLKKLNINHLFLWELQKLLYQKKDTAVPIKQILDVMIMCRGDLPATVATIAGGFRFLAQELQEVRDDLGNRIHPVRKAVCGNIKSLPSPPLGDSNAAI
jgi:hypothetical protein